MALRDRDTALAASFRRIPVLLAAEASAIAARVIGLRGLWRQRNDTGLYHTLGAVSEEDARAGLAEYLRLADPLNALLRQHFADLLETVRRALETWTGERVRLHERFGLPGLMIYTSPRRPATVVGARPHRDAQYRLLDWGEGFEPIAANLLSFTLPLALPRAGAGLRIWPEVRDSLPAGFVPTASNATFLPYEPGVLLCHDGLTLHHGIAMRTDGRADDSRITLQGFGVRVDGEWRLYW